MAEDVSPKLQDVAMFMNISYPRFFFTGQIWLKESRMDPSQICISWSTLLLSVYEDYLGEYLRTHQLEISTQCFEMIAWS